MPEQAAIREARREAHLPQEARLLCGISWFPLHQKQNDGQVERVLTALGKSIS